jgi:hypothetical protein
MIGIGIGLSLTLGAGGGVPWRSFGGLAFRVGGQILRVTSKALVVENPND